MVAPIRKYKAAAVTAEPGWFDLKKSVEKTIHWINEAGKADCKLIAFPELCKSLEKSAGKWTQSNNAIRDSWLPILDVEGQLPGESSSPQEVP